MFHNIRALGHLPWKLVLPLCKRMVTHIIDSLAGWSKVLAPGASPQGRGFEPHRCYFAVRAVQRQMVTAFCAGGATCRPNKVPPRFELGSPD